MQSTASPVCFTVEYHEVQGRLDPFYYKPEFRKPTRFRYQVKMLEDICDRVFCGPFGTEIKRSAYVERGVPLIRITNTRMGEFDGTNMVYISEKDSQRLASTQLTSGDLVISQRGTIGSICQIPEDIPSCNMSANIIGIKPSLKINPKYLLYFLISETGQRQFRRSASGHIQSKITTEDVKTIKVPVPPQEIQDQIAAIMNKAYNLKRANEAEIESISNSIEKYVLAELGYTVPQPRAQKAFSVRFTEIRGSRVDPSYHHPDHRELEGILIKGRYPVAKLDDLVISINKGVLPNSKQRQGNIKVLQIRNITPFGSLDLSDIVMVESSFAKEYPKTKLEVDDLIVVITGATIGKVAVFDLKEEVFLGGDVLRIGMRKDKSVPLFILAVLLSIIGQRQIIRYITGATNKHLSMDDLMKVLIPLPPLSIQQKIASDFQVARERRSRLREEACQNMIRAKTQLESMILE